LSIWEWALEAYARPGVAQTCLKLQDEHGQNVPLLLWGVWASAGDASLIARAAVTARDWDAMAVSPLRAIRRALKSAAPPVDDERREAVRSQVKAVELQAERVLLETLEQLTGDSEASASPLDALKAASAAWGSAAPDDALAALAKALS